MIIIFFHLLYRRSDQLLAVLNQLVDIELTSRCLLTSC